LFKRKRTWRNDWNGGACRLNGLFGRGVVMSSTAKAHKRKDGRGVFMIAR
jgi:hypothetical protein